MSDPAGYQPQALVERIRDAAARRGWRVVAGEFVSWGGELAGGALMTALGRERQFELAGRRYVRLHHRYKRTWVTERAVEVPLAREFIAGEDPRGVLEVGNVLSHYGPVSHTVIDKYERAPGVLARDVMELGDLGPFRRIVAISTLEHVGWDEEPRQPVKATAALRSLLELLAPGGRLLVTVPAGYNPHLDAALRDGDLTPAELYALRRRGREWREVAPAQAWSAPYDFLLYRARTVVVAIFTA